MAMDRLSLGRLLELLQFGRERRLRMIERDARRAIREELFGKDADGGDFYGPFWADAKRSVIEDDFCLKSATEDRIAKNKGRRRLYPGLLHGFEAGWTAFRESRISGNALSLVARLAVTIKGAEAEDHIRATNVLAVRTRDSALHIVYPYFSKDIKLGKRHAQLGLAILRQGFAAARPETVGMLDVLRGNMFVAEHEVDATPARDEIIERYDAIMREWRVQKRMHRR